MHLVRADPSAVRRTRELIFGNQRDGGDGDPFERSLNTLKGLRGEYRRSVAPAFRIAGGQHKPSTDLGQNLPDAERRALAARVALSFGLELGDDSDEAES